MRVSLLCFALNGNAQINDLIRSTPESEGLDSRHITEFLDGIMANPETEVHSCIIMRHGRVIGEMYPEPWKPEYRHTMYSASKTFTSAAIGICLGDSLISLSDSIHTYLSEYYPEVASDTVLSITIRDLLTMESGLPVDTRMRTIHTNWLQQYFAQTPIALPGTLYAYDSISTYMLAAIVQKVTGMKLFDFLNERLFRHMNITRVAWEESPEGINCGGWGLYIQPESMAKFGHLLLREGRWNGMQLIPEDYVHEMMSPQATTGKYGYQMWMCNYEGWTKADGAYGQRIYVIPEKDMVVAITQCGYGWHAEQQLIHDALTQNAGEEALPSLMPSPSTVHKRRLKTAQGKVASQHHSLPINIELGNNVLRWKKMGLKFGIRDILLTVTDQHDSTFVVECLYEQWKENTITALPYCPRPFINNFSNLPEIWKVAGSYAWADDDKLRISLQWTSFLTAAEVTVHFKGGTTVELYTRLKETGKLIKSFGTIVK